MLPYFAAQFGDLAFSPPAGGFASEGEEVVWYALKRRQIPFVYQFHPGDIPFTPEREERSADFAVPSLRLALHINSEFTHPNPLDDQLLVFFFRLLGYESYFLWDYEILAKMGGNVERALDKVPGLRFVGQAPRRKSQSWRYRKFGQPARQIPYLGTFGR